MLGIKLRSFVGMSLKTGSLTIALLEMIVVPLVMIGAVCIISILKNNALGEIAVPDGISNQADKNALINGSIAMAVIHSLLLIMSIILLGGVTQQTPWLFIPWFVYEFVIIISTITIGIWMTVIAFRNDSIYNIVVNMVYLILFTVLRLFYILVVFSHYSDIKDNRPQNLGRGMESEEKQTLDVSVKVQE